MMIPITPTLSISENELHFDFIRSSGPGGQNGNKVATAAQLRFDVKNSATLQEDVKSRLVKLAGSRITEEGVLLIESRSFRTQEQNREAAILKLVNLIRKSLIAPRTRRKTRPTAASVLERIQAKKQRSELKKLRRKVIRD